MQAGETKALSVMLIHPLLTCRTCLFILADKTVSHSWKMLSMCICFQCIDADYQYRHGSCECIAWLWSTNDFLLTFYCFFVGFTSCTTIPLLSYSPQTCPQSLRPLSQNQKSKWKQRANKTKQKSCCGSCDVSHSMHLCSHFIAYRNSLHWLGLVQGLQLLLFYQYWNRTATPLQYSLVALRHGSTVVLDMTTCLFMHSCSISLG